MSDMLTGTAQTPTEGQAAATTPSTPATPQGTAQAGQQAAPKQESAPAKDAKQQSETKPADKAVEYSLKGDYDAKVLSTYTDLAKELQLSPENAQKVLDQMAPAMKEAHETRLNAVKADWLEQSKNDPEFGGAKLEQSLVTANKAFAALASPALQELLKDSGLANHPEMVRMFRKAGEMISTDRFVGGNQSRAGQPTGPRDFNAIAESFYKS